MSSMNKKKSMMTQKELSEKSGLSQQMISMILRGDRTPSLDTARALELASGICREAWLFPERHWNPYVPWADPAICIGCPLKLDRIKKGNLLGEIAIAEAKDKREGFEQMCKIEEVLHGLNRMDGVGLTYRDGQGRLLCYAGTIGHIAPPYKLRLSDFPWAKDVIEKHTSLILEHCPHGIPKGSPELAYCESLGIKFFMLLKGKWLIFQFMSTRNGVRVNSAMIKERRAHIDRIEEILKDYPEFQY